MTEKKDEGTKLTPYARQRLERSLLDAARAKIKERFDAKSDALAKLAIKEVYGEDAFEKFAAVPTGWLARGYEFRVRPIAQHEIYGVSLRLSEATPMPYSLNRNSIRIGKKLYQEIEDYNTALDEANDEYAKLDGTYHYHGRSRMPGQIKQALAAIKTVEELQEKWPEAYLLLPAEDGGQGLTPKYNLPALPIADAIGLYKKLCGS